jgi:hypothetical protein
MIAHLTDSFDLHVLTTPPTFILSQDQTLQIDSLKNPIARDNHQTEGSASDKRINLPNKTHN